MKKDGKINNLVEGVWKDLRAYERDFANGIIGLNKLASLLESQSDILLVISKHLKSLAKGE